MSQSGKPASPYHCQQAESFLVRIGTSSPQDRGFDCIWTKQDLACGKRTFEQALSPTVCFQRCIASLTVFISRLPAPPRQVAKLKVQWCQQFRFKGTKLHLLPWYSTCVPPFSGHFESQEIYLPGRSPMALWTDGRICSSNLRSGTLGRKSVLLDGSRQTPNKHLGP